MNVEQARAESDISRHRPRHGWRRCALWVAVVFLVLPARPVTVPAAPQKNPVPLEWRQRLQSWLDAIADHRPGEADAPAYFMGAWSEGDLDAGTTDLLTMVTLYSRMFGRQVSTYHGEPFGVMDLTQLLKMTGGDSHLAGADRLLMRAAILHADVAMRVVSRLGSGAGCSAISTVKSSDGTRVGAGCIGFHWRIARTLLDAVSNSPDARAAIRLWYHATSAFLLEELDYANASFHIDHGQARFPEDPAILFEHGLLHEALASASVQIALRGLKTSVPAADVNLRDARGLYESAVRADPDFVEARVRLARVLGVLGRHEEAERELSKALLLPMNTRLTYYAELFMGDELRALGRRDDARSHYKLASETVPIAQSPKVALGFLARQAGDRAGALQAVQQVLALPASDVVRADPWWTYYNWQSKDSVALLRELYQPFLVERRLP